MKLGVLFSGGKDSNYALFKSRKDAVCLISIISKNKESYMFHVPNIHLVEYQAESMGLPLIKKFTEGEKEKELEDLREAIEEAKKKYKIEGIVTGAVESVYQASRIQKICDELGLWCFNPLWLKDQVELLNELIKNKFEVIISGVFAYPFNESWLGRKIDEDVIGELVELKEKYKISISGEGGEYESSVLNSPMFKKKIKVVDSKKNWEGNSGVLEINKVE